MSHRLGYERKTTHKAIQHPTIADIAWAAGFLEGEGCFSRTGGTSKYGTERIWCGQKDPECLHRLLRLFGGSLGVQRCKANKFRPAAEFPIWGVSGSRARGVMLTIYQFMSERRKEAIKKALQTKEN